MIDLGYLISAMAVMCIVTYLVRMIPMVIFRKKITNRWVNSFLYYVPYAVLAAMTFPGIFTSTGNIESAIAGCIVAVVLALFEKSLLTVAVGAVLAALVMQLIF